MSQLSQEQLQEETNKFLNVLMLDINDLSGYQIKYIRDYIRKTHSTDSNLNPTFHSDIILPDNYVSIPLNAIDEKILTSLTFILKEHNIWPVFASNNINCKFHQNQMFIYIHHKGDWFRIDFDLTKL